MDKRRYNKSKNNAKKKKGKYSKFIIVLIVLLNVAYTYRVLEVVEKTGVEPTAITKAWFNFTTYELLFLSGIKVVKVFKKEREDNSDEL